MTYCISGGAFCEGVETPLSREVEDVTATLCGSFRRDHQSLRDDYLALVDARCRVLSPTDLDWAAEVEGFVLAQDEVGRAPSDIEETHLRAMRDSHFVWLHSPDGYVGRSGAMELGYAHALGVPVFGRELPVDVTLAALVTRVDSVDGALKALRLSTLGAPALGLDALQRYYSRAAQARGWASEGLDDCLRLLTGELDELGHAIHDGGAGSGEAALEMADVQLYLVHLANIAGVDLGQAVVDKEHINTSRFGPTLKSVA